MDKDSLLPYGYDLGEGVKIHSLLFAGENWQIYDTHGPCNILITVPDLAKKWSKSGLIEDSMLGDVKFGPACYRSLSSPMKFMLSPVEGGRSPDSKVDAISFATALKESRRIAPDVSFHDAIYVEQYSRLLPTWTLTPRIDDQVVLGMWITGGVTISVGSFRRLVQLAGWMSPADLADVVTAAGLLVPESAEVLVKQRPRHIKSSAHEAAISQAQVPAKKQSEDGRESNCGPFVLPGRPQLERFFNEHVIDIIFNPDRYKALGISFPAPIILHGPPGCGKTFAVERLVEYIDWPIFSVDSASIGSPFIHETSKRISTVFDKAIDNAPSVILIDEMEAFLSDRHSAGPSGHHHVEEVAEFLRRIPEAINSRVLIIAMTNLIGLIDPAILRRGRFDHVIEVGMPSRTEVKALLGSLLAKVPVSMDLNLAPILDALTGKPLSDSAFVIREAARIAAKSGKTMIDQESLASALSSLPEASAKGSKHIGFGRD